VGTKDAKSDHRLNVYYNGYRLRLIESMAVDFPKLQEIMGDEDFNWLVVNYIEKYPSNARSVRWAGNKLVKFMQESDNYDDFLAEIAKFEWAMSDSFDATNPKSVVQLDYMEQIEPEAWPAFRIKFCSFVNFIDCHYNVPSYWKQLDNKQTPPEKIYSEIPTRWLIWRHELDLRWRSLDVSESWALETAMQKGNFATICEGLLEWHSEEQVALIAAGFLKQWLTDGLIEAIYTD